MTLGQLTSDLLSVPSCRQELMTSSDSSAEDEKKVDILLQRDQAIAQVHSVHCTSLLVRANKLEIHGLLDVSYFYLFVVPQVIRRSQTGERATNY